MSSGVNVEEAFTSQFPLAVSASEDLAAWIAKVVYTEEYGSGGARQKRAIKRVYGSIRLWVKSLQSWFSPYLDGLNNLADLMPLFLELDASRHLVWKVFEYRPDIRVKKNLG